MSATNERFSASTSHERIELLDAIRGFALCGILLMNLEAFSGPFLIAVSGINPALSGLDYWTDALIYIFVQGKFWTLFALLFGMGFALMQDRAARAQVDFFALYSRRLWGLLIIGLLHFLLVWEGDILVSYALAGFCLLWFFHAPDSGSLRAIIILLASPILLIALLAVLNTGSADDAVWLKKAQWQADVYGYGSYSQVLQARYHELFKSLFSSVFLLPISLALFVLGARLYRREGLVQQLAQARLSRRALCWYGTGLLGIVMCAYWVPFPNPMTIDRRFALVFTVNTLGSIAMCLGSFYGLQWLWGTAYGRSGLRILAPLGRMALSNYLLQSLVCTLIFYGYGLGYYQQLPRFWQLPYALVLLSIQVLWSHFWLRHFALGPVETLWRYFTYPKCLKFVS